MVCYRDQGPYAHKARSGSLKVDPTVGVSPRAHLYPYMTSGQNCISFVLSFKKSNKPNLLGLFDFLN